MKPRQTIKNYHNSSGPPYQPQNSSTGSHSLPQPGLRDIDLARLGLNLDDMANLQAINPNLSNQDEIVKCLQALYAKGGVAKLPPLNDWPMQSISPPDYSRLSGLGGANFNPNINNNGNNNPGTSINTNNFSGNSGQHKQELHFNNSHHHHSHFRISTPNTHSPQQQQQQLPQQKSVLSLHQQHHIHHQHNDLSNRRSNHHMSTPNASSTSSYGKLSSVVHPNTTSISNNLSIDANSLNNLGSINKNSAGTSTHVPNVMDNLGPIDNIFYDGNTMPSNKEPSSNSQSLIKHQHLQKLLKATGNLKSSNSASNSSGSSTNLLNRNETQTQRIITSNNMSQGQNQASAISPPQAAFSSVPKSLLNLAACSSSSPTSSSSSSMPSNSKFSSMVSQLNMMHGRMVGNNQVNLSNNNNVINYNNNNVGNRSSSRTTSGNSYNTNNISMNDDPGTDAFNQRLSSNGSEHVSMLQHMSRSSQANNHAAPSSRSSSKQAQMSLLSDDQSFASRTNPKNQCNVNLATNTSKQSSSSIRNSSGATSKEAFLASLQERAARAGVSIGEISKPVQVSTNQQPCTSVLCANTNPSSQQQATVIISPKQSKDVHTGSSVDRREIESALSRVEARNDLSLLYPPILLATNSQKEINALSAGLESNEDSELFTKEVKKIISEECNIIYECKECNNLFRSLANLVKHKRTFCLEYNSSKTGLEVIKRNHANPNLCTEQPTITINHAGTIDSQNQQLHQNTVIRDLELSSSVPSLDTRSFEPKLSINYSGSKNSERRNNLSNMLRRIQMEGNKESYRDVTREMERCTGVSPLVNAPSLPSISGPQTSLSRLLQSQPKNRLPVSRDSALISALNMTPVSNLENPSAASDNDKIISNCTTGDEVNEQLVCNSSLAKTLLNEKVKVVDQHMRQQSLNKLARLDSVPVKTRVAPKRKFLEDCIKKVKRDKLLTEEEDEEINQPAPQASKTNVAKMATQTLSPSGQEAQYESNQIDGPSDIGSKLSSPSVSEADSDVLTIDLDSGLRRNQLDKRAQRRVGASTAASSTASSSASSVKLNTSSALLKALTRPVDNKRSTSYQATQAVSEENQTSQQEAIMDRSSSIKDNDSQSDEPMVIDESEKAASPLFDKYTCDLCELDYNDLDSLLKHTYEEHPEEKSVYPCIFCSLSFIALENVCRHIIEVHKKPKTQVQRLKEVVRSRTYVTSDFLACSDHPPPNIKIEHPTNDKTLSDDGIKNVADNEQVSLEPEGNKGDADNEAKVAAYLNHLTYNSNQSSPSSSNDKALSNDGSKEDAEDEQAISELEEDQGQIDDVDKGDMDKEARRAYLQQLDSSPQSSTASSSSSGSTSSSGSSSSSSSSSSSISSASDTSSAYRRAAQRNRFKQVAQADPVAGEQEDGLSLNQSMPLDAESIVNKSHMTGGDDIEGRNTVEDDCDEDSQSSSYIQSRKPHGQQHPTSGKNDPDASIDNESCAESEGGDYDSTPPREDEDDDNGDTTCHSRKSDDTKHGASASVHKQSPAPSVQSSKSETGASTSSQGNTSGSGGIMKLKIQLKARPDEKSKVYEIV